MLVLLTTADADLDKVQQNVKKELDALEAAQPSPRAPFVLVTADYAIKPADGIVLANPLTSCSVSLPPAAPSRGLRFTVKNASTAGTVYVRGFYSATAPELIDGVARRTLAAGASATCFSDGAAWWAI
jgi:hypothetical protein